MLSQEKIIEWYTAYSREIFIYLVRLLGNTDDAEDILHDCFANLIEYSLKHELREDTIKSFLYRSAHNSALNHLASKKTKDTVSIPASDIDTSSILPHDIFEGNEMARIMENAISQLDPVTRSIFIMKKELSMASRDIARNLDISEKTVRRKLEKAMNVIILELKKNGFEI